MKHRAAALVLLLLILFLALATFLAPLAADPAAHVELGWTPGYLVGQLHGLSQHWYEYFSHLGLRSERPLITLMLRYRDELGLSPEQVQTLERLRADFEREATRREAEIRSAEADLTTLVEADSVDLERVEAKLRAIERQRADLRLARIQTIEQGKATLTPEQRAKLRALLTEHRSRTYPPGERF